jgi:hypothetical protein
MTNYNVPTNVHSQNWGQEQTDISQVESSVSTFLGGGGVPLNQWDFQNGYFPSYGTPVSPVITSPVTDSTPIVPTINSIPRPDATQLVQETASGEITTTPTKTDTTITEVPVPTPTPVPVTSLTKNISPYVVGLGLIVALVIAVKILK